MDPNLRETLTTVLEALRRLMDLFRVERFLHLASAMIAFLMLVYAIMRFIVQKDITVEMLTAIFGSAGLIAVSVARINYFFKKAFGLIEDIIRKLLAL